jgi:prophage tail gpP-like protein
MFKIKVNGREYNHFLNFKVSLNYSAMVSTFSFSALDTNVFKSFARVQVYYANNLLLTGNVIGLVNKVTTKRELVNVSGYSLAGKLQDCTFPKSAFPLQFDNLTLGEICAKISSIFGINIRMYFNPQKVFDTVEIEPTQKVADFLIDIASQRNALLTHGPDGGVIVVEHKNEGLKVQEIINATEWVNTRDYQSLYSEIYAIKEQEIEVENAGDSLKVLSNVKDFRPITIKQNSGNEADTDDFTLSFMNSMLKNFQSVQVKVSGFRFKSGDLILPNCFVKIQNTALDVPNPKLFFLESVEIDQGSGDENCTLNLVMPTVESEREAEG